MEQPKLKTGNLAETDKTFCKMYNLSSRNLNEIEKSVLLMGLKFTPTPEHNNSNELNDDINMFFRNIRLREYFDGLDRTNMSLVKNKTSFTPPSGRNVNLDTYITTSKTFISNMNKEHNFIKHNITLEQRKAIKVLSED